MTIDIAVEMPAMGYDGKHAEPWQHFYVWLAKGSGLPMDADKGKVTLSTAPRRES